MQIARKLALELGTPLSCSGHSKHPAVCVTVLSCLGKRAQLCYSGIRRSCTDSGRPTSTGYVTGDVLTVSDRVGPGTAGNTSTPLLFAPHSPHTRPTLLHSHAALTPEAGLRWPALLTTPTARTQRLRHTQHSHRHCMWSPRALTGPTAPFARLARHGRGRQCSPARHGRGRQRSSARHGRGQQRSAARYHSRSELVATSEVDVVQPPVPCSLDGEPV